MAKMTRRSVTLARDALDEGHPVIAHHLNAVFDENAPGVHIDAEKIRTGDSLPHAADQFRIALHVLRNEIPIDESKDDDVRVWTLGYINGVHCRSGQCFVTIGGIFGGGNFDLVWICEGLLKRDWSPEQWIENIQLPVMKRYSGVLADLNGIEAPEQGISIHDLALAIEEDDAVATRTVKTWVDNKWIRADPIGKCPLDGRRSLYRLSELLSDVKGILSLDARELAKYRQALTAKLRTPRNA